MDSMHAPVASEHAPDDTLRGHDVVYIRGSKGDEGSSRAPVEGEDTLFSTAYAHVLDLVSEGEIGGLVDGLQSVYLDETPIQNPDGTMNFKNVTVDVRLGTPDQDYMPGFPAIESEVGVGVELKAATPWSQALNDLELSAVSVRISTPALTKTNPENGDIGGYSVNYVIELAKDGGAFSAVYTGWMTGKTVAKYERTHRIDLPAASVTGWIIRVRRLTADTTDVNIQDTTTIESYTAIIDAKMRYPYSALIGVSVDSSQFRSVPRRAYNLLGVIVQVPSNYDPQARTYTGVWDGTFKSAWTNNPAWLYYAMATNERFGLGSVISPSQVDKWALYAIGQYCDGLVPTGQGIRGAASLGPVSMAITAAGVITASSGNFLTAGFLAGDAITLAGFGAANDGDCLITSVTATTLNVKRPLLFTAAAAAAGRTVTLRSPMEPRFTTTIYLQKRGDAYKVLQDLASTFRGISYWGSGAITAVADKPEDPVFTYTNANVVDGKFTYQGSGRRARHTVALVSWNDPSDFGRGKVEYVSDDDGIARYGIQETNVTGFGCTSQSQAQRIGRWILLSERLETDTVGFNVGLDGTLVAPGKIIRIADEHRMGKRVGGRISASTAASVTVDKLPTPAPVPGDVVIVALPTGLVEKRTVLSVNAGTRTIVPTTNFSAPPVTDSIWSIESTTLVAPLYRVIGVTEGEGLTFNISVLKHEPQKFDAVEQGTRIMPTPTTNLPARTLGQPTGLALTFHERAGQTFVSPYVSATWTKLDTATKYMTQWRRENGEWTPPRETVTTHDQYDHAFAGTYDFRVWGINASGIPSLEATASLVVGDQTMVPGAVEALQTQATATAAAAAAAQASADAANADLTSIASDNVLSIVEKKRVIADRDAIAAEQAGIDASATSFGITTEKTAYDSSVTALTSYLATLTTPTLWSSLTGYTTIVGTTFRSKFADVYANRQTLLNKIAAVAKGLADAAQNSANTAIANAATAQTDATNAATAAAQANADLANIASDSLLTPGEKPTVIRDRDVLIAEQTGLDANATAFGITTEKTNYDSSVTALTSYLATLTSPTLWSTLTGNTTIVGATFRSKFADVYAKRQVLLNKVATAAKALADAAQVTANTAVTNAGAAQTDATSALNTLSDISSDSLLTPVEKPAAIRDRDAIVAEQAGIDAQATAFAIGTEKTAYDAAVTALTSYLATLTSPTLWSTLTGNTTIVGDTFRQKFLDVYSARQALLNKIYATAKAISDGKISTYYQSNAPYTSGGTVGDLWTDTDTNVTARWDGSTWVPSSAYVATANGANLIANSTFSSNLMGFTSGAIGLTGKQMVDGWYCTVQADANSTLAYCSWSPGIIRCQVGGSVVVPASGNSNPQVRILTPFSVDPGAVYSCDFNAVYAYNGALNAGITASSRMLIRWLDTAGNQISIVAITRPRGAAAGWGGWTDFTAPSNAVTAVVFLDVYVANSNGTATTACTSTVALQTNFVAVAMVKKSLLAVPGSGVQVGDSRNLPPLIIGNGTAKVPTVVTYSAAAGTPATATISVAAWTMLSGSVSVSYGAKSVGVTGTNNTTVTYFLYLDDPTYSGTGTLVATTNGDTVYQNNGRLFIGTCAVTYPASGTSTGGGTGGGRGGVDSCVCVDMFLAEGVLAADAVAGMLIDCLDLPTGSTGFRRAIEAVEFSTAECVRIITEGGAVLDLAERTPFDLPDGRIAWAPDMLGELVVTDLGIERVASVQPIGAKLVAHVHAGGVSYAAGRNPAHRIFSHNVNKP